MDTPLVSETYTRMGGEQQRKPLVWVAAAGLSAAAIATSVYMAVGTKVESSSLMLAAAAGNATRPEEMSTLAFEHAHAMFLAPPIIGLLYAAYQWSAISKIDLSITEAIRTGPNSKLVNEVENPEETLAELKEYARYVAEGSITFLVTEYTWMAGYVIFMCGVIIGFYCYIGKMELGLYTTFAFVVGAATSVISGYIGMQAAVKCNIRTTFRVWTSGNFIDGLDTAMRGGCIMGFGLCSLGVVVMYALIVLFRVVLPTDVEHGPEFLCEALAGFGLGGSSIALFGRVGGGIFTKAADVGSDLSGKLDNGLEEDDPRNPACIADNVGDNVGDIAGMGADLFGSFAESTVAALVIAAKATPKGEFMPLGNNFSGLYFPVLISSSGIIVGMVTMFIVFACFRGWCKTMQGIERTLKYVLIISTVLQTPVVYGLAKICLPQEGFVISGKVVHANDCTTCVIVGLWAGLLIGIVTEYYTSFSYYPVRELARNQLSAAATGIIYGLALGYKSCIVPVLALAAVIVVSHQIVGMYGVALAALGMLSTLTMGLTVDAYGPVSDNAGGLAEMAKLPPAVRQYTDALDAAGNTTAAIGKGFAIGSAALVALALFGAFKERAEIEVVDVTEAWTFAGLFIGALLPFAFSAMTMESVALAAAQMVEECGRQFPKILSGEMEPDYETCIRISTEASLQQMVAPGLLVILSPLVGGVLFGKNFVAGLLCGGLVSGVQMAISMSNSGGAWDNAKKFFKAAQDPGNAQWFKDNGVEYKDKKWHTSHDNAVTGDTVGDPLKDTSGPSLNILVKLSAITSLVFGSVVRQMSNSEGGPMFIHINNTAT
jgi:inorganic pyrophosphatase